MSPNLQTSEPLDAENEALSNYFDSLLVEVESDFELDSHPEFSPEEESQSFVSKKIPVITFSIAGLRFAIEVADLAGIQVITEEIQPVESEWRWLRGKTGHVSGHITVLDPKCFVNSDEVVENIENNTLFGKSLVTIDGGRIGFLADDIEKVSSLPADKIKWNKRFERRPWLRGVIMSQALAIIDCDRLKMLINQ